MKNNTKLIMETWRRFLNEDENVLRDEPEEGYFDDDYNPEGLNPDSDLDSPIEGEPPFEDSLPVSDPHLASMEDEVFEPAENDYDEIPYTQEDAMMTPDDAFDERYGDDDPFGDDDGPY
jgi:hypothetical protein